MLPFFLAGAVGGSAIIFFSPALPELWVAPLFTLLVLLALCRFCLRFTVFLLGLGVALSYANWRAHGLIDGLADESIIDQTLQLSGEIIGLPNARLSNGREQWRVDFRVDQQGVLAGSKIRLSWYDPVQPLTAGQRWQLQARLRPPRGFANAAGFDYGRWLIFNRYAANGYVKDARRMREPSELRSHRRSDIATRLREGLLGNPSQGLIMALSMGDRSGLGAEDWAQFQATGTSHLMAISGLHIGVAAGFAGLLAGGLRRVLCLNGLWALRLPALAAALTAFVYAWLAGFALPTQRALIMTLVAIITLLLQRRSDPWLAWLWALVLVLLLDPFAWSSTGFYLSFGAVASLLLGLQMRRFARGWQWLLPQWVVFIGLLPLLALHTGAVSMSSLPANIVAIPLVSLLIVPGLLLALVLMPVAPGISATLWQLCGFSLELLQNVLAWIAALPLDFATASVPASLTALALISAALLLLPKGFPLRGLLALPLLAMRSFRPPSLAEGEFELRVFDVGQGLSVLLQTRDHAMVYDLGPEYSEHFNTAEAVVLPNLQSRGLRSLDVLMISHGDKDHAGGVSKFIEQLAVERLISGEPLPGIAGLSACEAGQQWFWNGVSFEILHPRLQAQGNNSSCVLRVSSAFGSALLPGDIEREAERELLRGGVTTVDVLVAPHHGSNTSSTATFLDALQPEYAIASAGYRHRFGHPAKQVRARYLERGIELLNTADDGEISIRFTARGREISGHREQRRHWWD